jgi:hypothetical protein
VRQWYLHHGRAGLVHQVGEQKVTLDCPPLWPRRGVSPEFSVVLSLSSGPSAQCPGRRVLSGQGLNRDSAPGASAPTRLLRICAEPSRRVDQPGGKSAGSLIDRPARDDHASVFSSATTNVLIDGSAGLPGPGSVSLRTNQLQ